VHGVVRQGDDLPAPP